MLRFICMYIYMLHIYIKNYTLIALIVAQHNLHLSQAQLLLAVHCYAKEMAGLPQIKGKMVRSLCSRLKGKEGRCSDRPGWWLLVGSWRSGARGTQS